MEQSEEGYDHYLTIGQSQSGGNILGMSPVGIKGQSELSTMVNYLSYVDLVLIKSS